MCPKGHYCPSSYSDPIACPSGTYADVLGRSSCELCTAGYSCLNASVEPLICGNGTYSSSGQVKCEVYFFNLLFK